MKSDLIDLTLEIIKETYEDSDLCGAILVKNLKKEKVWLPKSVCSTERIHSPSVTKHQDVRIVTMPVSWASDKGLV